jgi:23S rRNA pseudouridine1911/1915/1917 synthase
MMKVPQTNLADYSASASGDWMEDEAPVVGCCFVVPDTCAGWRFDQALASLMPQHSRSRLQAWLRDGYIRLEGVAHVDAKRKVWGGERVDVDELSDPRQTAAQAEDIPINIVFEDEAILVLDKPAGLVVHPGSGNWHGTLMNALLHHDAQLAQVPRAGIVHRLDKETSGLMVVAKTVEAQTSLVRQLQARSVKRHYLALALGMVKTDGCVDAPIGRHPSQRIKMAVVPVERQGKEARTHYSIQERLPGATLLECRLETGRTHQIRVHMASIGHPLVGDSVYGMTRRGSVPLYDDFNRQALHAWRLALNHPDTQAECVWEAALPDDFSALLNAARKLEKQ